MLLTDLLRKALKKTGFTETPIKMTRQGTERCFDARPCYGTDGKWLTGSQRGEDCQREHVEAVTCGRKHKHTYGCLHRVHAHEEVDGVMFMSTDGKFTARVYADAQVPAGAGYVKNRNLNKCAAMKEPA